MGCAGLTRWRSSVTRAFIAGSRKPPTSCRKSKNWKNPMIHLRPDCLVFKTPSGESIPCSAQDVTIELVGDAMQWLDREVIENAAAAVLHYFRVERNQDFVSVSEFTEALERVLRGFGFEVAACNAKGSGAAAIPRVVEADLRHLAEESGAASELFFFQSLRAELRRQISDGPAVFRYRGLRGCVKSLAGAKRWSTHCQTLNDQIVDYLRNCLGAERAACGCALVVT